MCSPFTPPDGAFICQDLDSDICTIHISENFGNKLGICPMLVLTPEQFDDFINQLKDRIKYLPIRDALDLLTILMLLVHERRHCDDSCQQPLPRTCEAEQNATEAQLESILSFINDLNCWDKPRNKPLCEVLVRVYQVLLGERDFFECMCALPVGHSFQDCADCVKYCYAQCENLGDRRIVDYCKYEICAQSAVTYCGR